jgi:hypothetical protein
MAARSLVALRARQVSAHRHGGPFDARNAASEFLRHVLCQFCVLSSALGPLRHMVFPCNAGSGVVDGKVDGGDASLQATLCRKGRKGLALILHEVRDGVLQARSQHSRGTCRTDLHSRPRRR